MPDGQLLGHHPAEGDADDRAGVPTDEVEQGGGIVGIVGHGVGTVGDRRLPEAALVVGHHREGLVEGAIGHAGLMAQITSGARDAQQANRRAVSGVPAGQLVVDVDPVDVAEGHPASVPGVGPTGPRLR